MKNRILKLLACFMFIIPCLFMFTACGEDDKKTATGLSVELYGTSYTLTGSTITTAYGEKIDLGTDDFKVTVNYDDESSETLSVKTAKKDGYTFASTIPTDGDKTPVGEYTITFGYGDLENVVITVKVVKANVDMTNVAWNYSDEYAYNGTEREVKLTGLPSYVSVAYEGDTKATIPGDYNVTAKFTVDTNCYNPIADMELDWEIVKGTIDVSGVKLENYVYSGATRNATVNPETLPENVEVGAYNGETTGVNAGTYVVKYTLTYTGEDAEYYNPIELVTGGWTIEKAPYTKTLDVIALKEDYDFTYDGTAKGVEVVAPSLDSYLTIEGYNGNIAETPGDYIVSVDVKYIGTDTNYCSPEPVTLQWTIKKATLTVYVYDSEINYGEAPVNRGYTITGHVKSSDVNLSHGNPVVVFGGYEMGDNAGEYDITVEGLSSELYDFNIDAGTLTVNKVNLAVSVIDTTIDYNEDARNNGVSVTGLVAEDELSDLGTIVYNYGGYEKGSDVGSYDITVSGLDETNYNITYNKGTLTVAVIDADVDLTQIALKNSSADYTGEVHTIEVDNTTLPEGVSVTSVSVQGAEAKNANSYTIVIGLKYFDTTNYNPLGEIQRTYTINKATVDFSQVALVNNSFTYNGELQVVQITSIPVGATLQTSTNIEATDVCETSAVFTFICTDSNNYVDFGTKTIELDWAIVPAELTLTVENITIDFGDEVGRFRYSVSGLVLDDNAGDIIRGEAVYSCDYESGADAGSYPITLTGLTSANENYTIKVVNGSLTVNPIVVDVTDLEWDLGNSLSYNGEAQKPVLQNIPMGLSVEYSYSGANADCIAVGSYTVTPTLTPAKNYTISGSVSAYLYTITQATIDVSNIEWENEDGHQYEYTGSDILPVVNTELMNVVYNYTYYLYNDELGDYEVCTVYPKELGQYKVEVEITTSDSNYTIVNGDQVSAFTFEIVKAEIAVENVRISDGSIVICESLGYSQTTTASMVLEYTGTPRTLNITADNINKFDVTYSTDGDTYSETNSFSATDEGSYSLWIKFALKESDVENYTFNNGTSSVVLCINLTIEASPFTSITLNGEAYSYEELLNAEGFKVGSVLAFTVKEGYRVTSWNNEVTSITINGGSYNICIQTVDEEGNATSTLLDKYLKAIIIDEIKIGNDDAVVGTTDLSYYLARDENSVEITFDEKYLAEYSSISYYSPTYTNYEYVQVTSLPIVLTNVAQYMNSYGYVQLTIKFVDGSGGSRYMNITIYAYDPIEAYYVETVDKNGNLSTSETNLNVALYDKILVGFYAIGKDGTKYDNVKLYADYNRTEEVQLTNLNKIMGGTGLYYTIYDESGNVIEESNIRTYGYMGNVYFDDENFATEEVYESEYTPYSYSNSLVTIKSTVAGQTTAFALTNDLTETSFKYEFTYGGKTYTYDGKIRIIKTASTYDVSSGSFTLINTKTSKSYNVSNYTSGCMTYLYTEGNSSNPDYTPSNIEQLRADLQYFTVSGLRDGYTLQSIELTTTENTALLKFTIKNGDTTYVLYSRIFAGTYSAEIKSNITIYNVMTGESTTPAGNIIQIADYHFESLKISVANYEKVVIYDSNNNKIYENLSTSISSREYFYLPSAGTYTLVITASNGTTTRTITINASGEDVPAFKLEIGETTKVIETFEGEPDGFITAENENGVNAWTSIGSSHLESVEDGMIQIDKISSYLADYTKVYDSRGFEIDLDTSFKTPVLEDAIGRKYFELQIEIMEGGEVLELTMRFYLADSVVWNIFNVSAGGKECYYGADENLEYAFDAEFAYDCVEGDALMNSEIYLGASEQSKIVDGYYTVNHIHSDFPFVAYDGNVIEGELPKQLTIFKNVPLKVVSYNGKQCVYVIMGISIEDFYAPVEIRYYLEDEPALDVVLDDSAYVVNSDGTSATLTEEVGASTEYKVYSAYLGAGAEDLISSDNTILLDSIYAGAKVVSVTDMVTEYVYDEFSGHTKLLTNMPLEVGIDNESRPYASVMVEVVDGDSTKKVMVNFYLYEASSEAV